MCLPISIHDSLHDISVQRGTILQKFFSRVGRRSSCMRKYFSAGKVFECLANTRMMMKSRNSTESQINGLTLIITSRVQRINPMPPPLTCTGADIDARISSWKTSKSISKVKDVCPLVSICMLAISRQIDG